MKKISGNLRLIFVFVISISLSTGGAANEPGLILKGKVISADNKAPVPFITLMIENTNIGVSTDENGEFQLNNLPIESSRILVRGMGYQTTRMEIDPNNMEDLYLEIIVPPSIYTLNEVIFTASPTASGFRYQSDLSFVGEELQKRSEVSFGEMLDGEPGIAMRSLGSAPARPVIRGMDGDRILILEHGERMGDVSESGAGHSLTMDPLSANRLEVVKGPASLMYGSSALGGVINLMTSDIPEDWDMGSTGILSAQGATVNNMGAGFARYTMGMQNHAFTGRFAYRNSGNIATPEGKMPGTYMNNYDAATGFGIQRENVSGGISLSLNSQTYGLPEHLDDPYEQVEVRQQRYGMNGRFNFDRTGFFDKAQLRFNASILRQEEFEMEWEDGRWDEDVELYHHKNAFSSTLTLQHVPFSIFDRGAIGLNIHGHNLDIGGDEAYTPGENRLNAGIFIYQEVPLSGKVRMQAGTRLDIQHTGAIANEVFPDVDQTRNAANFTGSLGINYRPLNGLEIGGQFARSHRNPMVEELFANGPHLCSGVYELGSTDLKDEIGHGGDLFVNWGNQFIQFEVSTFLNLFDNFIIFQPTGDIDTASNLPIFEYTGDKARFYGGEFSMNINPINSLKFGISMDYVNARRNSDSREYLPFIPPFRFRAETEYDFGLGWVSARVRSAATQNRVAPEEDATDGYTLLGMAAGFRINSLGNHVIILRGDNILNTKYRDHLSRVEDRHFSMPGRNINLAYRLYLN